MSTKLPVKILTTVLSLLLVVLMFVPMLWVEYHWNLRRCSSDALKLVTDIWI